MVSCSRTLRPGIQLAVFWLLGDCSYQLRHSVKLWLDRWVKRFWSPFGRESLQRCFHLATSWCKTDYSIFFFHTFLLSLCPFVLLFIPALCRLFPLVTQSALRPKALLHTDSQFVVFPSINGLLSVSAVGSSQSAFLRNTAINIIDLRHLFSKTHFQSWNRKLSPETSI